LTRRDLPAAAGLTAGWTAVSAAAATWSWAAPPFVAPSVALLYSAALPASTAGADVDSLFEAIRDDWVQRRGAADPDALRARNNLASAYAAAGRLDDAVALYASTLADCEQVLGRNHLTTRTVRESLQRMR
jgi:hypothetical protein